jgi:predicted flap endonuclease-1-like 5' DNA nuclease
VDTKEIDRLRADYEALSKEHSELKREVLLSKAQPSQAQEPKPVDKPNKAEAETKPAKASTPSASSSFSQFSGIRRDPFEKIDGVGPIFEERLWNAGVFSFAQLATMSPDRIRQIVDPQGKQPIVPEDWIKEAGEFARGDKKL